MSVINKIQQPAVKSQIRFLNRESLKSSARSNVNPYDERVYLNDMRNVLLAIMSSVNEIENDVWQRSPSHSLETLRNVAGWALERTDTFGLVSEQNAFKDSVNVGETIAAMTPLLEAAVGSGVKLLVDLPKDKVNISLGAGRLEQLLLNLTLSARSGMNSQGVMTISLESFDTYSACLSMSDDGEDIPETMQRTIFCDDFTQSWGLINRGSGLAQVQAIVEEAGGDISVDSNAGFGTTIRAYLPCVSPPVA